MIRKIKLIILFSVLLTTIPCLVNAKSYTTTINKDVTLNGGSKITDYAKIDEDYIKRLVIVNKDPVKSTTTVLDSEAVYYSHNELSNIFTNGAYAIPTKKGTISDLGFSTFYPEFIKMGSRVYDVKISINSVFDEENGIIISGDNEIHLKINESNLANSNSNKRYHGLNMHIDIFEKGTNKRAKIPDLVYLAVDLDGGTSYSEGIRIKGFVPNKSNTFVSSANNTINYASESYYGTASIDDPLGGNGDVFFHIPKLQNEGELDVSYAGYTGEVGTRVYFLTPKYNIKYQALEGGKIIGNLSESKFTNENISGTKQEENKGYKFLGWTCNEDVLIDSKTISKGEMISDEDLTKIIVTKDLVLTANYEKNKYMIETKVQNGKIDDSKQVLAGTTESISYIANDGYHLKSITVDGKEIDISNNPTFYTFSNISENHKIEVIFEINKYKINTKVTGGIISPSTEVKHGDNETIEYSPEEGYRLNYVKVDGSIVDFPKHYDFKNVMENHDIEVVYEPIPKLSISKTSDKKDYKENDIVEYTVNIDQTVEGAIAKDIVVIDALPEELVLDSNSLSLNKDIEILEISDNHFKLKIKSLDDTKTIVYKAKVKKDISLNELTNTVTAEENEEKVTSSNTIYIPRGKIDKSSSIKTYKTGDIVTYEIKIDQLVKGATFHNLIVEDELPNELELIEASLGQNKIEISQNKVKAVIEELDGSSTLIIKAKALSSDNQIRNVALLKADELSYPLSDDDIIKVTKESKGKVSNSKSKEQEKVNTKKDELLKTKVPMTYLDGNKDGLVILIAISTLGLTIMIFFRNKIFK